MNLAQYQQTQPPIQGTDAYGNLIDDGSYMSRGRRSEFMTMSTASKLGDLLEAAGIDATIAVTSEDQVNYKMAAGEKRLRYSYTIDTPEGPVTKPLGLLFATIYEQDIDAKGKLWKRLLADTSGSWVGFTPDLPAPPAPAPPAPVQQPAPTGYHWVQGLMGQSLAKDSTLGLTDAQKTEILNRVAKALE